MFGHQVVTIDGRKDTSITNQRGLDFEGLRPIPLHMYQQSAMHSSNEDIDYRNIARKHTRICRSNGIPTINLLDLSELCRALSGAISGHISLPMTGISRLDMALGSVRIDLTRKPSQAMVIDLDHANKRGIDSVNGDGRTGTPTFMAAEQLDPSHPMPIPSQETADVGFQRKNKVRRAAPASIAVIKHSTIHDMESVLWLFCYACIFYNGPGDPRGWSKEANATNKLVWTLFDGGNWPGCAANRREALAYTKAFETYVIRLFTPYFGPIRDLAADWRRILYHAYCRRDKYRIHEKFLQSIVTMEGYLPEEIAESPTLYMLSEVRLESLHRKREVRAPEGSLPASEGPEKAQQSSEKMSRIDDVTQSTTRWFM